jgi:hypothetical protein
VSGPGAGGTAAGAPRRSPVQLGLFAAEQLAELLGGLLEPVAPGGPAPTPRPTAAASRPEPAATASPRPAVRPLGSGSRGGWLARWSATSASRPNVVYIVGRRADGAMGCTCPGWIYHPSRPQCRHILAVLAAEAERPA